LKSSLKGKRSSLGAHGALTIVTSTGSDLSKASRSEPATPTLSKNVHFDAHLEHVKLFLAEQKPLAVSRDGSPTDTSGTDNDFPSFIYDDGDDSDAHVLVMHRVNVPLERVAGERDVQLERLEFAPEIPALNGIVRVKNLAFEKWVAVRFTLDWWQTTSEVTARYVDSVEDGVFDRFAFVIKLHDVMARAEEKTLFLAVRYTITGREIWDNNNGANYQVRIAREKTAGAEKHSETTEERTITQKQSPQVQVGIPDVSRGDSHIEDLKCKLEQVARGREATVGSLLTCRSRQRHSLSATPSPPPSLKSDAPLSSRYDFAESFRTTWQPPASPVPHYARTSTYPAPHMHANTIPWPQKICTVASSKKPIPSLGSPRDSIDDADFRPAAHFAEDSDDGIDAYASALSPSLRRVMSPAKSTSSGRAHQRGGYLNLSTSGVRRTPPGSPVDHSVVLPTYVQAQASLNEGQRSPMARFNSYPPSDSTAVPKLSQGARTLLPLRTDTSSIRRVSSDGSEESTPSFTSPSSASESSRSSSPVFEGPGDASVLLNIPARGVDEHDSPVHHLSDYHVLLNRSVLFFKYI